MTFHAKYSKQFWGEVKKRYMESSTILLLAFKRHETIGDIVLSTINERTWMRNTKGWSISKKAFFDEMKHQEYKMETSIEREMIAKSSNEVVNGDIAELAMRAYRKRYIKADETVNLGQHVTYSLMQRLATLLGQDPDHISIRSVDDLQKVINIAKVELNEPTNISGNLNKDVTTKSESNPDFFDV